MMVRAKPLIGALLATACLAGPSVPAAASSESASPIGRHTLRSPTLPDGVALLSATYTPSGKLLITYQAPGSSDERDVALATMNDDGTDFRPFFAQRIPERPRDNGLRYMVFPDNRRIFTGDFVIECAAALEACEKPALLPVTFPTEVDDAAHVAARWSEIIVAPDNRHVAWTTLLAGYTAAVVLTGELRRDGAGYVIADPRIINTLEPFLPDPNHADGVLPQPIRGGEVKQFIAGGKAISAVGAVKRDLPNSIAQDVENGTLHPITDTPGYTETTIFSPNERLGVTMTTQHSPQTSLAVAGLVPRPYPAALNMGLSMFAYTHAVTGVRKSREGNVGPALIEIAKAASQPGYAGTSLDSGDGWVFTSPISWHPGGMKAAWVEIRRGTPNLRLRLLELPDYRPGPAAPAVQMPQPGKYSTSQLSAIPGYAEQSTNIDVKVYGRSAGYITYRRSAGRIEKHYYDYSDDGRDVWSGSETTIVNPGGTSTYTADVKLAGKNTGAMNVALTFGPLSAPGYAALNFSPGPDGQPLTRGYAAYNGRRLDVSDLIP